jgi:hypothetical protein
MLDPVPHATPRTVDQTPPSPEGEGAGRRLHCVGGFSLVRPWGWLGKLIPLNPIFHIQV